MEPFEPYTPFEDYWSFISKSEDLHPQHDIIIKTFSQTKGLSFTPPHEVKIAERLSLQFSLTQPLSNTMKNTALYAIINFVHEGEVLYDVFGSNMQCRQEVRLNGLTTIPFSFVRLGNRFKNQLRDCQIQLEVYVGLKQAHSERSCVPIIVKRSQPFTVHNFA